MHEIIYPTAFSLWGDEEKEAIDRVRRSGRWTKGREVAEFEDNFAKWHKRQFAIMTNSGSSANLVAVSALAHSGLVKNSLGVVPAIAWSTTYAPLRQIGYDFRISDVDDTWNADNTFTYQQPGFIVGCSVLGVPGHLGTIAKMAKSINIPFLEDNCESLGAITAGGKRTGTYGDISTFSFFHSHQISAIEGGMILTDNPHLARLCKLIANHGNAGWGKWNFEEKYDFRLMGYNVRPLELHAAIANAQLKKLPRFIAARQSNLELFWKLAKFLPITPQLIPEKSIPSPFGIAFTVNGGTDKRTVLAQRLREAGIDSRPPTGGSFTKHAYGARWKHYSTPKADLIHDTGMFLGNAPYSIPLLIEKAVNVMREVLL